MKLSTSYEKKLRNGEFQEICIVSKDVYTRDEAAELCYDDFEANLYINGKFVADISPVLAKTCAFTEIIDDTDWEEIFYQMKQEVA